MIRAAMFLTLLLLASCAGSHDMPFNGGYAPVTHEPYGSEMKPFDTHPPDQITWKPGPPSLPPGAQIAVLEGDPGKEGPFVFRVKVPDGYTIPSHTHPRAERVTVIQGTFNVAEGDTVDKSPGRARVMPAGTFGYWPARMHHYAWVTGETIAQFHGYGPWVIQYLNPSDDPRHAKKP